MWSHGEHLPLLRNSDVSDGRVPRTGVRGFRMALLRNSIAMPCPFALEFQSQRDGMCHRTNRRIIRNGFL